MECNDFRALTHLAGHSDTVLLAPSRALKAELEAGALVPLDLVGSPAMTVEFVVVHLAQRTLSPAADRAVAVVEAAA